MATESATGCTKAPARSSAWSLRVRVLLPRGVLIDHFTQGTAPVRFRNGVPRAVSLTGVRPPGISSILPAAYSFGMKPKPGDA